MADSKECALCHRIGYRGFVPYGAELWCCYRDDLCRVRAAVRKSHGSEPKEGN